jgi:putative nucleotidyltransferase with HDIG domain
MTAWQAFDSGKHGAGWTVRLAELLGALSHALDLTEGQPEGHCKRCCWIGTNIGRAAGLTGQDLSDLYFTLLLKDLGCSSNSARICDLYLADDISFKRDFKRIDGSLVAALRFVLNKTGLEAGLAERIRAIVNILQNGGEITRDLIETRCHRGAEIAAKLRFNENVQAGIRSLDEHWAGNGKPERIAGTDIPLPSRIALLSQIVDVFRTAVGKNAALEEVRNRAGTWFDPQLAALFEDVSQSPEFWDVLAGDKLDDILFSMEPALETAPVDESYMDEIASAFADVVDAKSPFTAGHSERVTLYTDMIAEELGLAAPHRRWLRRAALLHDIGKLAVSNMILDKPGKLDEDEWLSIRDHPLHSERILQRVGAFADIAPIAGAHHEKLNGKGYPYGLERDEICLEARILTVADVFDALSADRPYRRAMDIAEAVALMEKDSGTAFDPLCLDGLKSGLAKLQAEAA